MLRPFLRGAAALVFLLILLDQTAAVANHYSPRQYYGNWRKHTKQGYHYRSYYYKPSVNYVGYRHHYAIHFPSRPKHIYYYNPYKKQYWGRCPVQTQGKPAYSLLAEKDRSGTISDIPESAFPPPGPMPKIPDAEDDATLDLPPDDLPADDAEPQVG
jgi:hypothetical protein